MGGGGQLEYLELTDVLKIQGEWPAPPDPGSAGPNTTAIDVLDAARRGVK